MNFIEIAIFILLFAVIAVPFAARLHLPLEIFLLLGSLIASILPGSPIVTIDSVVVFELFLPPVLFSAAYFTSWRDLRFNFRPVSLLAIGLVFCTAITVAVASVFLLPGFTWAEGFLLGAIVSPTDASAATTIIKKLGAPKRLIAILEGESLVNDATALTLYRFSLVAILTGTFSFPAAFLKFFIIVFGGLFVGLVVSYLALAILKRLNDVKAEATLTILTAFLAYIIAEHMGVSGVISTVVSGLYFGINIPETASTRMRLYAKGSWATLLFVINGFVFILLGLEFPGTLKNLAGYSLSELIYYGAIISIVVIAIRMIFVFPAAYLPRIIFPSIEKKDPHPPWQQVVILGWTGMRGIVSLAAVLALPRFLPNGTLFPHGDLMVFITYCVIVATLIPATLTLPSMMQFFKLTETINPLHEEAIARIRALEGVIERIKVLRHQENISQTLYNQFLDQVERRLKIIQTQLGEEPFSTLSEEYFMIKKLTIAALASERATLLELRRTGEIQDEIFHLLSDELDIEETRVQTIRF